MDELQAQRSKLEEALVQVRLKRQAVRQKRQDIEQRLRRVLDIKAHWWERINATDINLAAVREEQQSVAVDTSRCMHQLHVMMQINVANDCFYIWHMGPFATINGFKIGRLPAYYPVEWSDINAALGQAMLLLSTVVDRAGFTFRHYRLQPMGSFSKIIKMDDSSNKLNLYYDDNFTFFPKRNFNSALQSFLKCMEEFGNFVEHQDPTLRLPYRIKEGMIDRIPITFNPGGEEAWTRALKYLMTDLKWIVAWASKHVST